MIRSVAGKVAWVGRTAAMVFGLALVLALVLGVATVALAAVPGDPFLLGRNNPIDSRTTLAGNMAASPLLRVDNDSNADGSSALDLRVEPNRAPMTVNSPTRVDNLNADLLDGESADQIGDQIGINGYQRVSVNSGPPNDVSDSDSFESVTASCPHGKVVVGTGYDVVGAKTGIFPDQLTDVVADEVVPVDRTVTVRAYEQEPTNADWSVTAIALCATTP